MQMVNEAYEDAKMWTTIRAYLLSWKVVFDHFTNAVCCEESGSRFCEVSC